MVVVVVIAACGGPQPGGGGAGGGTGGGDVDQVRPPPPDTRTELERRRDAGCEALAPRLVQCAVDDARAELDAGKVTRKEFELSTSAETRRGLAADWLKKCRVEMSSRQVRVLEVCFREEQACEPLLGCLENLSPGQPR